MKLPLKILLLITLVFLFIPHVIAQESFDFNRAYLDYDFTYGAYRKAYEDYKLARNEYLAFKTLASRERAVFATRMMLEAQDDAIKAYLTALRLRLVESVGVPEFEKNTLFGRIDPEVEWYKNHKPTLASVITLEGLVDQNLKVKDRFNKVTIGVIYKTLYFISEGKLVDSIRQTEELTATIKNKVSQIEAKGDKDTTVIKRWIGEGEVRIGKSQQKIDEARNIVERYELRRPLDKGTYQVALTRLDESHKLVREAVSFLKEIIREIRTAD
ncbi:hypothetical protein HY008_00720 [Candidatus Woesebacteria bacterium]|nr:hypothetical protein [Candidatus Woesebacteria bacterium]